MPGSGDDPPTSRSIISDQEAFSSARTGTSPQRLRTRVPPLHTLRAIAYRKPISPGVHASRQLRLG